MSGALDRPEGVFDREHEWRALARFAASGAPGATMGFVSGRRRQGKTLLLQALCEATGGFYYEALQAEPAESLRHLGVGWRAISSVPAGWPWTAGTRRCAFCWGCPAPSRSRS